MRKLLERRDGAAIRDTLLWFALILGSAYATYVLWGSWWAALPYAVYAVLYASTSDSRWHESSHSVMDFIRSSMSANARLHPKAAFVSDCCAR